MYYCDLCETPFINKTDFSRHLNRVKKCGIETSTNNIKLIKEKYGITQNCTEIGANCTKINKNCTKIGAKKVKNDNNLECEYCYKVFCRQSVKKKHIIESCKKKKELDLINFHGDNQIITTDINNMTNNTTNNINNNSNNTIINNNITQHITQNIKLNGFGKEDISYVTNEFLHKVIKNPGIGIPKLVELIHFNPDHPENNNVKIINKREPYLDYFNGDSWKTADKSKVIGNMLLTKKGLADNYYYNNDEDELDKHTDIKEYEKYSETVEFIVNNFIFDNLVSKPTNKSVKKIYNNLEKDIYTLILNHRKYIKDNNLI